LDSRFHRLALRTICLTSSDGHSGGCHATGDIEFSLAGHGPILHDRASGVGELALQFPLGMFADTTYRSDQVHIEAGDCLALLTDDVTEAAAADGQEFGLARSMPY
jgi:serine phosphatase RsbU (regulator of sigma subunit)